MIATKSQPEAPAAATVLVVEDTAIVRDPIAACLRAAGYRTLCASNGREALALIRSAAPGLVLLDLTMPEMDGLTFLRHLRQQPLTAQVPVILLTSTADRQCVVEAAHLGVRDYLLKSRFSLANLITRVGKHFQPTIAPTGPHEGAATTTGRAAEGALPSPAIGPAAPSAASPKAVSAACGARVDVANMPIPALLTREASEQRVQSVLEAKSLSGVVAQVISLAASPRGDMTQLASLIAHDAMLSARVLRAANSATYTSNRGMVSTIPDAVRQVGCSEVRNIASALGIFDAMPESMPDGFNPIRCWQHSFAVAMLSEQLATADPSKPAAEGGVAYLVGLCHDLGEILFQTHFGSEYRQVLDLQAQTGRPREELERAMLGMTQGELVLTILKCIGLPDAIRQPIEAFHAPRRAGKDDPLVRVLRLADHYANGLLLASSGAAAVATPTRAQCKGATGMEAPPRPEGTSFRSNILALTAMLARLSAADEEKLTVPLFPKQRVKLWLARDQALSDFDPVATVLELLADTQTHNALPSHPQDAATCDGLVVCGRNPSAAGWSAGDIQRAVKTVSKALPILWLIGEAPADTPPHNGRLRPFVGPVSIGALAAFVESIANPQIALALGQKL